MAGCGFDRDGSCPSHSNESRLCPSASSTPGTPHTSQIDSSQLWPLQQPSSFSVREQRKVLGGGAGHPALVCKGTGGARGAGRWQAAAWSSGRVWWPLPSLAAMDSSRHPPASLCSPAKHTEQLQQSTLQPADPPLLSRACCGWTLAGLRGHSTWQSTWGPSLNPP